jgi:ElaB/YqjD/DUF883 family membrane-anchored ribosome-binding protein
MRRARKCTTPLDGACMTDENTRGDNVSQDAGADVEASFEAALDFVKRQLRENPVAVLVAAAGIGLAVGLLLGRRR